MEALLDEIFGAFAGAEREKEICKFSAWFLTNDPQCPGPSQNGKSKFVFRRDPEREDYGRIEDNHGNVLQVLTPIELGAWVNARLRDSMVPIATYKDGPLNWYLARRVGPIWHHPRYEFTLACAGGAEQHLFGMGTPEITTPEYTRQLWQALALLRGDDSEGEVVLEWMAGDGRLAVALSGQDIAIIKPHSAAGLAPCMMLPRFLVTEMIGDMLGHAVLGVPPPRYWYENANPNNFREPAA